MRDRTIVIILGGGRGTRLYPLTKLRAKPAVPIGGKYRLIDIPISNCINSGIFRIFVLTQYLSDSLIAHIGETYRFGPFVKGGVEILAAQQKLEQEQWYQGTADAVRQNLHRFRKRGIRHILVLSGDHLYRMDYSELLRFHVENKWDITVAVNPCTYQQATGFGVLKVDAGLRIRAFHEKPKSPEVLERLALGPAERERAGIVEPGPTHLGSMGIYVFQAEVMDELLANEAHTDFGGHILPAAFKSHRVGAFPFSGYWQDIGTVKAYFDANLQLTDPEPVFRFHVKEAPIYTHPRYLSPSVIQQADIQQALIGDGANIDRARIRRCVIGLRTGIGPGADLERCVVLGADYYPDPGRANPEMGIGAECVLKNCVVDKNASIGAGSRLTNEAGIQELEAEQYAIRDGIIVVAKNAVLPPGTVI